MMNKIHFLKELQHKVAVIQIDNAIIFGFGSQIAIFINKNCNVLKIIDI